MSYWVSMDGAPEPYFDDTHPAVQQEGFEGATIMRTDLGGARCGNYTSNVSGMWTRCLTAAATSEEMRWAGDDAWARLEKNPGSEYYQQAAQDTEHLHLRDLAGKTGEQIAPLLAHAVEWGVAHLADLHQSDPPNGWGDADGAVTFLWDIQRMCEQHPQARLHVSS